MGNGIAFFQIIILTLISCIQFVDLILLENSLHSDLSDGDHLRIDTQVRSFHRLLSVAALAVADVFFDLVRADTFRILKFVL